MTHFRRRERALSVRRKASDYWAGDLVWQLPDNLTHIGMLSARRSDEGGLPGAPGLVAALLLLGGGDHRRADFGGG
jgi:uncharacterized protein YijF (DUF1287 family)